MVFIYLKQCVILDPIEGLASNTGKLLGIDLDLGQIRALIKSFGADRDHIGTDRHTGQVCI